MEKGVSGQNKQTNKNTVENLPPREDQLEWETVAISLAICSADLKEDKKKTSWRNWGVITHKHTHRVIPLGLEESLEEPPTATCHILQWVSTGSLPATDISFRVP